MFMNRKTQLWQQVSSSQHDLWSQHNPHQNPRKLSCRYQQTDSQVYMERQNHRIVITTLKSKIRELTQLNIKT